MWGSNLLFDPRVNGFLTRMDDSTSMVSLALRDGVESSGRTVMEYKRNNHGGRERLIEEGATMVIWAFGINAMKNVYDWVVKDFLKIIDLPDLDTALLKQKNFQLQAVKNKNPIAKFFTLLNPPSSQTLLNPANPSQLHPDLAPLQKNLPDLYNKLTQVIQKDGGKYATSSMFKFLVATGMPVAAIAFGIPLFNQWLTRQKIDQEKKQKVSAMPAKLPYGSNNTDPGNFSYPGVNNSGFRFQRAAHPFTAQSTTANAFSFASTASSLAGQPMGIHAQSATPSAPPPQRIQFGASQKRGVQQGNAVHFGGLGDLASGLLQNERMNTLVVDGVISGGRIYQARNMQERAEIIFREGSIIAFLYFAQRAIQDTLTRHIFKKTHSQLSFDTLKFLNETYKKEPERFKTHLSSSLQDLAAHFGYDHPSHLLEKLEGLNAQQGGQFYKNLLLHPNRLAEVQKHHFEMEEKLVQKIRQYFQTPPQNGKQNLIFEVARECGWIPTWDGKPVASKNMLGTLSDTVSQSFQKAGNTLKFLVSPEQTVKEASKKYLSNADGVLNLTKKIDVEPIWELIKNLKAVEENLAKKGAPEFETLLKKAVQGRAASWFLSNAICTLFLSYICPKIQHYITFRQTGKNYFPGVQPAFDTKPAS